MCPPSDNYLKLQWYVKSFSLFNSLFTSICFYLWKLQLSSHILLTFIHVNKIFRSLTLSVQL